jgi:hypothetical protein
VNKIFILIAIVFVAAVLMSSCCAEKRHIPKNIDGKVIDKTARAWLVKLDKGYFQQCYDETAQALKDSLDKSQWISNMTTYRKPLGESEKRKEANMYYENKLQNADDGDYVVAQYASIFQQKLVVIESVTLVKEQDGSWKVFGYSLK